MTKQLFIQSSYLTSTPNHVLLRCNSCNLKFFNYLVQYKKDSRDTTCFILTLLNNILFVCANYQRGRICFLKEKGKYFCLNLIWLILFFYVPEYIIFLILLHLVKNPLPCPKDKCVVKI